MSLVRSLATLLALPLVVMAAPAPQSGAAELATTAPMYYLKTANARSEAKHFNDLYVRPRSIEWRSSSPLYEVVLTPNRTDSVRGFLNSTIDVGTYSDYGGSYQQFDLTPTIPIPWGFAVSIGFDRYHYWTPIEIQWGGLSAGFFLNDAGLQSNISGFGGWMACDWSFAAPQLFYINTNVYDGPRPAFSPAFVPSACAIVNLVPECI